MFNKLFSLFKSSTAISHIANIADMVDNMVQLFEKEFAADKDAKNAAIDSIIQILQEHKNK